ncbi:hypothetical protein ANCCAN_16984 [Ancylostoma caninum]|uniref:Uncharacterized protein n=1 Tax=Ancylostoma caninum TaxID=29170 RepID=A0A368FY63_ANCCA|nr:hypothetical protein ANCCAN_16984 [Ancylostoma caninum]
MTNIALKSTDDSRFMLPEARRRPEATTEEKEEEPSAEASIQGSHESLSILSGGESAEKMEEKDTTAIFESLDKPEMLDLKEEAASVRK